MWRRSVSSCVSPGPFDPMGPLPLVPAWRSRCVHMPIRRGSRYWYCASSTCRQPSFVRARWAKMSRIRPLRSSTCTPVSSVSTRICEGERSLSKMTIVACSCCTIFCTSATLPSPMKLCGSGFSRLWRIVPTTRPPAVSTSAASSARLSSSALSSCSTGERRPTSTASSRFFSNSCVCCSVFRSIGYLVFSSYSPLLYTFSRAL